MTKDMNARHIMIALIVCLVLAGVFGRQRSVALAPRPECGVQILLIADAARGLQARSSAAWPDAIRVAPTLPARRDERLTVRVCGEAELFRHWDRSALESAVPGAIVSHRLRRCLRALAAPRSPTLPRAELENKPFDCPDPRILIGSLHMLEMAGLILEDTPSASLGAFRLGQWALSAEIQIVCPSHELAYLPGSSEPSDPTPADIEQAMREVRAAPRQSLVPPCKNVVLPAM